MDAILGSVILAGGALFGIWLGAFYAAGRLEAQLDDQARWFSERREEESSRLERQLAAEAERLERQLDHDRRMRDRDELRALLDELARKIVGALDAVLDARHEVPGLGRVKEQGYEQNEEEEKARAEAVLAARTKVYELRLELQRLRLRFSSDHPVKDTFTAAQEGLRAMIGEISVGKELWTVEQQAVVDEKLDEFHAQNTAFIEACRRYTGVEIEQTPGSASATPSPA